MNKIAFSKALLISSAMFAVALNKESLAGVVSPVLAQMSGPTSQALTSGAEMLETVTKYGAEQLPKLTAVASSLIGEGAKQAQVVLTACEQVAGSMMDSAAKSLVNMADTGVSVGQEFMANLPTSSQVLETVQVACSPFVTSTKESLTHTLTAVVAKGEGLRDAVVSTGRAVMTSIPTTEQVVNFSQPHLKTVGENASKVATVLGEGLEAAGKTFSSLIKGGKELLGSMDTTKLCSALFFFPFASHKVKEKIVEKEVVKESPKRDTSQMSKEQLIEELGNCSEEVIEKTKAVSKVLKTVEGGQDKLVELLRNVLAETGKEAQLAVLDKVDSN